jgi:hypothetical protein
MKTLISLLLTLTFAAHLTANRPIMANWTGKQKQVQTVSGKYAWNCEYRFVDFQGKTQYFWKIFEGSCKSTVDVQ